jgi:hypothetical protein
MTIANFDDYLQLARTQVEAQRLLFVFAGAELPADASIVQRERFGRNEGGELTPLMCVDKSVDELTYFDALVAEAAEAGPPWSILFTAAMSGRNGNPPSSADAEAPLQRMIESIKSGQLQGMLPFDRHGKPVQFI